MIKLSYKDREKQRECDSVRIGFFLLKLFYAFSPSVVSKIYFIIFLKLLSTRRVHNMQATLLNTRESSSSGQLCEKVLCLCHRLGVSPQTCFDALLIAANYLGPVGSSKITPNSKKRVQEPISLVAAASVLAALSTSSDKPENSDTAVLQAASGLFDASFAEKITLDGLKKSAEEIIASNKNQQPASKSSSPLTTTAQHIQELHAALPNNISSQIEIKVAYLLLELLCLSHGAAVLQKGGALAAGACLTAAFCIASPPPPPASQDQQSSQVFSAVSTLTGFPDEVIFTQSQSLLHQALSSC